MAVVAVVTVTQGVDPQDPPTHSQYDFTLTSSSNVHVSMILSWIYSGFQNAFDALSLYFAIVVVVVVIGSIHFLEQHLKETRALTR